MAYELGNVVMPVKPSLVGLEKALGKQFSKASPIIEKSISSSLKKGVGNLNGALGKSFQGLASVGTSAGKALGRATVASMRGAATLISNTLKNSLKTATNAAMVTAGTLAAQVAGGGTQRAISINDSRARLLAMGKDAKEVASIMNGVSSAIDGTQYTLGEATKVASQLLNSGSSVGTEMVSDLQTISKLADISGRSFEDMGSIYAKNMSSGLMYADDLNQLSDAGVAIYQELAKTMGVSVSEVKKLASEGKVAFTDAQKAFDNIEWDSALYGSKSVTASFKNLRSQLSILGEKFIAPIIDNAGEIFNTFRKGLMTLRKNRGFENFLLRVNNGTQQIMETLQGFADRFAKAMGGKGVGDFLDKLTLKWEEFKQAFSGKEGLAIGAGAGVFGALLSNIPVIGQLFSGLNPLTGAFLGLITDLYRKGEGFKDFVDSLLAGVGSFTQGILDVINSGEKLSEVKLGGFTFGALDFDFKGLGTAFGNNIKDFVETLGKYTPDIAKNFGSLVDTLKESFSGMQAFSGEQSIGEILGKVIGGGLENALIILQNVLPLAVDVVDLLGRAITSDFTQGVLGNLVSLAGWLLDNEKVLLAGLGVVAGIVAGKKILDLVLFFKQFSKVDDAVGKGGKGGKGGLSSFGKIIANFVKGLTPVVSSLGGLITSMVRALGGIGVAIVTSMASIGSAVIGSAPALAALAGFILGIGGVIALLDVMNVFDILKKITDNIVDFIKNGVDILISGLKGLTSIIIDFVNGAIIPLVSQVPGLASALGDLVLITGGAIEGVVNSLGNFVNLMANTDSKNILGVAGAIGALAGSMGLLMGSMALGKAGNGVVGLITGDKGNGLNDITNFFNALQNVNSEIAKIPDTLKSTAVDAQKIGVLAGTNFMRGFSNALNKEKSKVKNEVKSMVREIQSELDRAPLRIKVQTQGVAGARYANGNVVNNNNSTANYRVNNSVNFEKLIRTGGI